MAVLKCMNGNFKTSAYDIHRTSPWFLTILDPYDSHYHTLFIVCIQKSAFEHS